MDHYTFNLNEEEIKQMLDQLQRRFLKNMHRHPSLHWNIISEKIKENPEWLKPLYFMEISGGEPDVVILEEGSNRFCFCDCAVESPKGRRSVCYDQEALENRKNFPPKESAMGMAKAMGIDLMTEEEYMLLQKLGDFDLKTSSWLKTPDAVRQLGGAIFGDKRFGRVFIYHNGADSYYGARGFRGIFWIE
jgi:hypothetical protein